eukprot:TRINITY_DN58490_c0_g1_i1.p1 TRINITY_DN58490_c0_g1~~TRINITY_DN58490_c0_g1_i1.p1  ORF type:complete len:232 (+),score=35.38 TRINITY_DN58490_c0_g1_i1:121-816(+)
MKMLNIALAFLVLSCDATRTSSSKSGKGGPSMAKMVFDSVRYSYGYKKDKTAVPMTAEEAAPYIAAFQGEWKIKAVDLADVLMTQNKYVKPIGYSSATVTGNAIVMHGGPNGRSHKNLFELRKSLKHPGRILLDRFGSYVVTPGWPFERTAPGQIGEVVDIQTAHASIRWTRTEQVGATPAFGESVPAGGAQAPAAASAKDRLLKLKGLLEDGLISEEEYNEKRTQIIQEV